LIAMGTQSTDKSMIAGLNIGGHVIQVKRDIFSQVRRTKLGCLAPGGSGHSDKDAAGNFFFDYSDEVMMPIVDWLRELRDSRPEHPINPPVVKPTHRPAFIKMLLKLSFDGEHLRMAGISAHDLWEVAGLGAAPLKEMGFDAAQLKLAHFTAKDLKEVGFTAQQLHTAGFVTWELKDSGYGARELQEAGYDKHELRTVGFEVQ